MKNTLYLFSVFCILFIAGACKKEGSTKITSKNASLIVGKWMVYQRHTRVYDITTDNLVKDTIVKFDADNNTGWWFEIYDDDGNAYITGKPYKIMGIQKADTTLYARYTINGSNITIKVNGGGSETKPILNLTETDLSLQSVYNGAGRTGWGLDAGLTYHFIDEVYYSRK